MAGGPLCGSFIEGREAFEVAQEHREMVVSAKAGRALAEVAESVVGELRMLSGLLGSGRYEPETKTLRELRRDVQAIAGDLSVGLREFERAAGWA